MSINMQLSDKGRKLLEGREGCRLNVYHDVRGLATIGVGHLIKAGERFTTLTQQEADDLFKKDVQKYVDNLNKVVNVSLTQDQFDALVSLSFNIGIAGLDHSSVLRAVNANLMDLAAEDFMMWHRPSVIIGRREEEQDQFKGKI